MAWNPEEYAGDQIEGNVASQAQDVLQDIETEHEEEVEHQQSVMETLTEAMRRIEEANLWKTLLSMDVFQQGSARPEIVKSVNDKIKKMALAQLELCVGIKAEQEARQPQQVEVKLPFDSEEMQALKILAAKVLKRDVTKAVVSGYTPQIAQVVTTQAAPTINSVKTNAPPATKPKPAPKVAAPQVDDPNLPTSKRPPKRVKPGPGYIPPTKNFVPPPQTSATVSTAGPVGSFNMQSLVNQLVQSASGGNIIAQDNSAPAGGNDINERF